MTHNRMQDQIAIVGVGSSEFSRNSDRTATSLAAEAAVAALRDAGLDRQDIDGVVCSPGPGDWTIVPPGATELVATLRLPSIKYFVNGNTVIVGALIDAMHAIFAGACDAVLVYHYNYRTPFNSSKAAADPYRRAIRGFDNLSPESMKNAAAYAAWCSRYIAENNVTREQLGRVAINSRTNAIGNPLAAIRQPMTMESYLAAKMVREPLGMFDMDFPIDGAVAFVLTTAERARDLPHRPVLVHTASQGLVDTASDEEQLVSLARHGQDVVVEQMWARTDLRLNDFDLAYVYDGFTFITMSWLEKLGWCGPGEAGQFLEQHWDHTSNRLMIDGRIPVNSQGGMLSEGGSQGAGFVREAVQQLRGNAGNRQIGNPRATLIANGGFFYNGQSMILIKDERIR